MKDRVRRLHLLLVMFRLSVTNSLLLSKPSLLLAKDSTIQRSITSPLFSAGNKDDAQEPLQLSQESPTGSRSISDAALSRTSNVVTMSGGGFDLDTALFCGGLAFDAYVEPPANSSRWERGVRFFLYCAIRCVLCSR